MLIEKIFHVNESVAATKARLANVNGYGSMLDSMTASLSGDGFVQLDFVSGSGFGGSVEIKEIPAGDSDQTLFHSVAGDLDLVGALEYCPIRPNLTEVVLTVDYQFKSRLHAMLDWVTGSIDRLLNQQLQLLQGHFRGNPAMEPERTLAGSALPAPFAT